MTMAVEQFCLKWNNFQTNILTAFESLQVTEDLTDVTLVCEGGMCIKAHKFILSVCSPYFRNIFKNNPCSHPVVILKDVIYTDIISLLHFMYHGEVLVSKDQLTTFLQTAEALQVSGLKSFPDVSQRKKLKRTSTAATTPINDVGNNLKKQKTCTKVRNNQGEDESHEEFLSADKIKTEIEITEHSPVGGSILEAALEVKDSPSILERSLTSLSTLVKPPLIDVSKSLPHKPPDDEQIYDIRKESDDDTTNDNVYNEQSVRDIPHHSSQCGNCPHCGKVYSNQSALKYHVRLVHSELLNLYCCHLCPLTFGFRDSYKKHMSDGHGVRS